MRSVASELVKTIGGIAQSAFPRVQDIGGGATDAALRGSLHGLASGVTAVTEEDASGKSPIEKRPLAAALKISAYIVGGIIVALVVRKMREATETPPATGSKLNSARDL